MIGLTVGARRVAIIEEMTRETGRIPDGPCANHDVRYGGVMEDGWFCDAHRYYRNGYWSGRCPNGRIADWMRRRFDHNAEASHD